jgi:hypothetical protein
MGDASARARLQSFIDILENLLEIGELAKSRLLRRKHGSCIRALVGQILPAKELTASERFVMPVGAISRHLGLRRAPAGYASTGRQWSVEVTTNPGARTLAAESPAPAITAKRQALRGGDPPDITSTSCVSSDSLTRTTIRPRYCRGKFRPGTSLNLLQPGKARSASPYSPAPASARAL